MSDSKNTKDQMSIAKFFNLVNRNNMCEVVPLFYHPDIVFEDPMVHIKGIEDIINYYGHLYENVLEIRFDIKKEIAEGPSRFASWVLHMRHAKLRGGAPIQFEGASFVESKDGLAIYHRDYFDLGAMVYEQIPVLGSVLRTIKKFAGKH